MLEKSSVIYFHHYDYIINYSGILTIPPNGQHLLKLPCGRIRRLRSIASYSDMSGRYWRDIISVQRLRPLGKHNYSSESAQDRNILDPQAIKKSKEQLTFQFVFQPRSGGDEEQHPRLHVPDQIFSHENTASLQENFDKRLTNFEPTGLFCLVFRTARIWL